MFKKILLNKKFISILMIILMSLSFYKNFFSSQDEVVGITPFKNFQKSSEYLVISKLYVEKDGYKSPYGLVNVTDLNGNKYGFNKLVNREYYQDYVVTDYASQFGLQGHIFNFLNNKLKISVDNLRLICCILLAVVLVLFSLKMREKYSKTLGDVFYLTFLLSPWVIAFAKNLYWVEFTWFLPGLLGLYLSTNISKTKIYLPLIFLAILFKCLCGYEYITCIMLFTIAPLCIDFLITKNKKERKKLFKTIMAVGIACLLGFIVAIGINGYIWGNGDLLLGIKEIYKEKASKRTFDLGIYNSKYGFIGNVYITLRKYFNWPTNILLGIPANMFKFIFLSSLVIVIYNCLLNKKNAKKELIMYFVYLITSISWFILGTGHSYVHTHMNYVLWYFGFLPIAFYVIIKFVSEYLGKIYHKEKEGKL